MLGRWVTEEESDFSDLLAWVSGCGGEILAPFDLWESSSGFRGAEISPFLCLPCSSPNLPAREVANWEQNERRFCSSGSAGLCSVLALQRKALYSRGTETKIQCFNFCCPRPDQDLDFSCCSAGPGRDELPTRCGACSFLPVWQAQLM